MKDYQSLLTSLKKFMESRLAFRQANLIDELQKLMGQMIKAGHLGGGRRGIEVAKVYENEARNRAELLIADLRQIRTSWSPKQLVDAETELSKTISDLFKNNLSEAADLSKQIGQLQNAQQDSPASILQSFLDHADKASKIAVSMLEAVISEVVAAAKNDVAARDPTERPSYVFQNTFNGSVTSFAQGTNTIGSVNQQNSTATIQELAEAVARIIQVLQTTTNLSNDAAQAKSELIIAEKELKEGKAPFGRLMGALKIFSKAQDIALKAPETVQNLKTLASMLGFTV